MIIHSWTINSLFFEYIMLGADTSFEIGTSNLVLRNWSWLRGLRLVHGPLETSGKVYYYMTRLAANFADDSQKFPWLKLEQRHQLLDLINFRWEEFIHSPLQGNNTHIRYMYSVYSHTAFPPQEHWIRSSGIWGLRDLLP